MADLQSSEAKGVLKLNEPSPGITGGLIACCGQAAPNLVAWWTPAIFRGDLGGENRRSPTLPKYVLFNIVGEKKMSRIRTVVQQTVFPEIPPNRQ